MSLRSIHETIIRDIFDVASTIKDSDEIDRVKNYNNKASMRSITSKAQQLTMVFPVICSRNMSYDAAAMVSKAIERKAVTLLQMLFSAANITDAEDGIDYLSRFHTNLNPGKVGIDDFMGIMDKFVDENSLLVKESTEYDVYKAIQEDMKAMNFYFECDNANEEALSDYQIITTNEGTQMYVNTREPINEDKTLSDKEYGLVMRQIKSLQDQNAKYRGGNAQYNAQIRAQQDEINRLAGQNRTLSDNMGTAYSRGKEDESLELQKFKTAHDIRHDARNTKLSMDRLELERQKNAIERDKVDMANRKAAEDILKLRADVMRNRLVDNDVKKANELVPTLMYVNFVTKGDDSSPYPIATSMVVGVKAKLYVVDGEDIMNRLKIKNSDKNLLLNLVKVSTGEISFFKDFLFAIDRAKIDAMSQSRRGSSNKIWKILERRAGKSKFRRLMNMKNDATAITTLCLTQDEVEFMRKTEYLNVEDPRIIGRIMDAYNLMGFVIADDAMEICKFLFDDGDCNYEVLTYNNLEREQKDNTKKILNLMSKMR